VLVLLLAGAPSAYGQERERPPISHFSQVSLSSPEYTGGAVLVAVGSDSLELGVEGLPESIFSSDPDRGTHGVPAARDET